jgi:hypothetical protein
MMWNKKLKLIIQLLIHSSKNFVNKVKDTLNPTKYLMRSDKSMRKQFQIIFFWENLQKLSSLSLSLIELELKRTFKISLDKQQLIVDFKCQRSTKTLWKTLLIIETQSSLNEFKIKIAYLFNIHKYSSLVQKHK